MALSPLRKRRERTKQWTMAAEWHTEGETRACSPFHELLWKFQILSTVRTFLHDFENHSGNPKELWKIDSDKIMSVRDSKSYFPILGVSLLRPDCPLIPKHMSPACENVYFCPLLRTISPTLCLVPTTSWTASGCKLHGTIFFRLLSDFSIWQC